MEMSPQRVRSAEFKTARKGADPEQVRAFLNDVADELERAQNQSTAMEARARAAVARLQEMSEGPAADAPPPAPSMAAPDATDVPAEQSDAIGRTLVLAQRTADSLIAEARAEAARLVAAANSEAATTRDSTREMAATMLDEAREEARRLGETERLAVAERGRLAQGPARLPRIRRGPSRAVPRRPAQPCSRRGGRTDRDHRPGTGRARRLPAPAAVGLRRRSRRRRHRPPTPARPVAMNRPTRRSTTIDEASWSSSTSTRRRRSRSSRRSTIGPTTATPRRSDRGSRATTRPASDEGASDFRFNFDDRNR